jgi:hypothetical protein
MLGPKVKDMEDIFIKSHFAGDKSHFAPHKPME